MEPHRSTPTRRSSAAPGAGPDSPPVDVPERIDSERLTLRCPRVDDVPRLAEAIRESLAELKPWMAWATSDISTQSCEAHTRDAIARFVTRKDLEYHFYDRSTDELIGCSGLHRIDWRIPRFEIGYWVRTSRAGQGYVSETVRALTGLAFERLGAKRVEIRCDDRNLASARVAERCGFQLDGILRNWKRAADGSLRDERVYSLLDAKGLRETAG